MQKNEIVWDSKKGSYLISQIQSFVDTASVQQAHPLCSKVLMLNPKVGDIV